MTGQGQVLSSSATGVSGAASLATGIAILPNTGSNLALVILGIATITLGGLVLISFMTTKVLLCYYKK